MVILDVGSRNGESVEVFVEWGFDVIHAFEPMPEQFSNIVAKFGDDERVIPHNFGLSDRTDTLTMYGHDRWGEASVFADKYDVDQSHVSHCEFVEASSWFAGHVFEDVIVKMNCEGSEVAILNNLMDSGEIWKIKALRVEFDISRVVGHEHEADQLCARMDDIGFDRYTIGSNARIVNGTLVDDVTQVGSHRDRLRSWLENVA